ncbi:MAG TPA: GNAT family protein [Candidatus Saccharimonadales bacterium]|nr:GNAT family protein [Candidatus Saccharimonadales bacterium]
MTEVLAAPSMRDVIDAGYGNVVLRAAMEEHGELIRELVNFDTMHFSRVGEDMPEYCASSSATRSWIEGTSDDDIPYPTSKYGIWAEDEIVGCAGHRYTDTMFPQIWVWIGAEKLRLGHATAAIQTLTGELFRIEVPQVDAWILEGNIASRRAFLKLGFRVGKQTVTADGCYIQHYAERLYSGANASR